MKLTIIRLQHFSDQDRIDLGKIWPSQDLTALVLDERHRIYAARFNERLAGLDDLLGCEFCWSHICPPLG